MLLGKFQHPTERRKRTMDVKRTDLNGLRQDLELVIMQQERLKKERLEIELRIGYLEKMAEVKEPETQSAGG